MERDISRDLHPTPPPVRQIDRSACRVHNPRSIRFRGPPQRRPYGTKIGQDRQTVPQEGNLHEHLQPLRQCSPATRARTQAVLPLVPGVGRRIEKTLRRLCRSQRIGGRARLRRSAPLLGLTPGRQRCRRPSSKTVRLRPRRRVPGHQLAPGIDPQKPLARWQGCNSRRRRCTIHLRLSGSHRT